MGLAFRNPLYQSVTLLVIFFAGSHVFARPRVTAPHLPAASIRIIENKGQWEKGVLFRADIPGGKLFITEDALVYSLIDEKALHDYDHDHTGSPLINGHNYRVRFEGASKPSVEKWDASATLYNYFKGPEARWASGCRAYNRVMLRDLYPGIHAEIISGDQSVKLNFIVLPGADPSLIRLKYEGIPNLSVIGGSLLATTSVGIIREEAPVSFSNSGTGEPHPVSSSFVLDGQQLSYKLGSYDHHDTLIIDPNIIFSTFSGSVADNFGFTATFDPAGNGYAGGTVYDIGFPTTLGAIQKNFAGGEWGQSPRDAGILKFSPDGSNLLYCTYLGGSANDQPHSMIVSPSGELIVMGSTRSADFPTTTNAYDRSHNGGADIFVSILSADGKTLSASTYFGGSLDDGWNGIPNAAYNKNLRPLAYNYGDTYRGEVQTDATGNIYIASSTTSSVADQFPLKNAVQATYGGGNQDGCFLKFNSSLSNLLVSTYIGGSGDDAAYGIAFDNAKNIFVCGGTTSSNITASAPPFAPHGNADAFIHKLDPSGASSLKLVCIGTPAYDQAYFIQTDINDNVYIAGQTEGNMPVSPGVYFTTKGKQFVMELDNALSSTIRSTVFGTTADRPDISLSAFLVDICGRVYVSGWGGAVNMGYHSGLGLVSMNSLPVTPNAAQPSSDGSDFYLIIFGKDLASLAYASFYGGPMSNEHVDGGTSRFDKSGVVYQSVCAGCGGFSDLPTTTGAWSRTNNGKRPPPNQSAGGCNNALFKMNLNVSEFAPEFRDTTIVITAKQVLDFNFKIVDKDGDSIYYTFSGSIFLKVPNAATIDKTEGIGTALGRLRFSSLCSDGGSDTFTITLHMHDNGCPVVRYSTGTIKIVVQPMPLVPAPHPECLKTINDNTLDLRWRPLGVYPGFKSFSVIRSFDGQPFLPLAGPWTNAMSAPVAYLDPTAVGHIVKNYCYTLVTENDCGLRDTSRTVCSLFRDDTSKTSGFIFSKDTVLFMYVFDTINGDFAIRNNDHRDSAFTEWSGNLVSHPKLLSFTKHDSLGLSRMKFRFSTTDCNDIQKTDTFIFRFDVKDNQCPLPRKDSGIIRLVVLPPPGSPPPSLECIRKVDDNTVQVSWPVAHPGKYHAKYVLLRKTPDGKVSVFQDVTTAGAFSVADRGAFDNEVKDYCYAVTSINLCGNYGDTCPFRCSVKPPSEYPVPLDFYTVTVQDKKDIAVFWQRSEDSTFEKYRMMRHIAGSKDAELVFESLNPDDTVFLDRSPQVNNFSYCYRLMQMNRCGLYNPYWHEECTILLTGRSVPFEHTLNWNEYEYWKSGVDHYALTRTDLDGSVIPIVQTGYKTTRGFDDRLNKEYGLFKYEVVAKEGSAGRGFTSTSNEVQLIQAPLLYVPNAFSANGDALNETFNINPVFVKDYHLRIFDRWGKMIFESTDKHTEFRGIMTDGNTATGDVFVYLVTYTGWDDSTHEKKGNFTILK